MRPNIADLLEGINRTIMSVSIPIVQRSGDMQALWEMATSSRIMSYIQKRWKTEFARLARDNMSMEGLIKDAAYAFQKLDNDRAQELENILSASHCDIIGLPSIDELEEANRRLKNGLDIFILAHSKMGSQGGPALEAVRVKIRVFLKEVAFRDFESAQEVIFF